MQTIGSGEAGMEATRDDLVKAIKVLRKEKEGLTDETIAKHPLLLKALETDDPPTGAARLRDVARALGNEPFALAVRGSLAIDFPAGRGADHRRQMMVEELPRKPKYLPVSERQAARLMNVGAEALADAVWALTHSEVPEVESAPAESVATMLHDAVPDTLDDTSGTASSTPAEPLGPPRGRRAWWIGGSVAAVVVVAVVFVALPNAEEKPAATVPSGSTAAAPDPALMAKYDGFDPRGIDGGPRCADAPPSQPIEGASTPPVIGPEGSEVGVLHLRRSPLCATVWVRVIWKDDEIALYKVPDGWTLHVVVHRPSTHTVIDATEPEPGKPPNAGPIMMALSRMLTAQPGCVFGEAYFTKDNMRTNAATTSCGG
ncbi:hypothetical protein [Amycolatopsis sp. NPDC054798]